LRFSGAPGLQELIAGLELAVGLGAAERTRDDEQQHD
jgi:hypothetical protein